MWCHLSEICHLLNKLRNNKLWGWLALWLRWVPSAPGAGWGLRSFLLAHFPQSPAGSSCGKLWGSLVPRAGNSGVVASPSREIEVTAAASDGRTTGNSGWRWPHYRACCWGSLAWPAAVSLASASSVSGGRVILSPPIVWLLSSLFNLTACFGDGRRLFGFALPSTIPPLGAMGVPWLLWGEGARKRLCRTNKHWKNG